MLADLPVFLEDIVTSIDGVGQNDVEAAYEIIADSSSRSLVMPSLTYLHIDNNNFFQVCLCECVYNVCLREHSCVCVCDFSH